jgi:hypothetical protein
MEDSPAIIRIEESAPIRALEQPVFLILLADVLARLAFSILGE